MLDTACDADADSLGVAVPEAVADWLAVTDELAVPA